MTYAENLQAKYPMIGQTTIGSIANYVENRLQPGGFLEAVFTNDLKGAFGRADHQNMLVIRDIVMLMYNDMPSPSQGSEENYNLWLRGEA